MKKIVVGPTINAGAYAYAAHKGEKYAIEFLIQQLTELVESLPATKQKLFVKQFETSVGDVVKVTVPNVLTGKNVAIRWDDLGGPNDPSTERYHCM